MRIDTMDEIVNKVEECISYLRSFRGSTWNEERYHEFWRFVKDAADPDYANFSAKIIPELERKRILGVRRPYLRKFATWIAKGDYRSYLEIAKKKSKPSVNSFEELSVYGFVIGYEKDFMRAIEDVRGFLPLIDNWAINDMFCACLKVTKKYPDQMKEFLVECLKSDQPYDIRFAIVMLLSYYINEKELSFVFDVCDGVPRGNYYIDMAVAWTVSMCYVKFRKETIDYLKKSQLDFFTYNKSIQKMIESNQVSKEEKRYLKTLKRIRE